MFQIAGSLYQCSSSLAIVHKERKSGRKRMLALDCHPHGHTLRDVHHGENYTDYDLQPNESQM